MKCKNGSMSITPKIVIRQLKENDDSSIYEALTLTVLACSSPIWSKYMAGLLRWSRHPLYRQSWKGHRRDKTAGHGRRGDSAMVLQI